LAAVGVLADTVKIAFVVVEVLEALGEELLLLPLQLVVNLLLVFEHSELYISVA
jgi:hypothetical protein